ncbi:MAG: PadR family transcriptional regulator [FCB group bacterium]|jgi:DNA-binding PadR family transcriptional regulator|nr:PadR family transcriptional regulator [FCB group bacterium]
MVQLSKQSLDGNVETIILSQLMPGANYGYALVREINEKHEGLLALGEGTIYPVLYRMEEKGLIESELRKTPTGRDRKYYRISDKGRHALEENLRQWEALSRVMGKVRDGISGRTHPTEELA